MSTINTSFTFILLKPLVYTFNMSMIFTLWTGNNTVFIHRTVTNRTIKVFNMVKLCKLIKKNIFNFQILLLVNKSMFIT